MNQILLLAFLFSPTLHAATPDPKLVKKTGDCKSSGVTGQTPILVVKEWHLSPGANTKLPSKKPPDQAANLLQIEKQVGAWIQDKTIQSIVAEGCEGKLGDQLTFNGWNLPELKSKAKLPGFESIVTHPALKLEAKYLDQVETQCGDSAVDIKQELLAFSDARADVGYYAKIQEAQKNPAKLKLYLEGVIEAYHLPVGTSASDAMKALKADLAASIVRIRELNLKRSKALARAAAAAPAGTVVIVGGSHASEIQTELEALKRNCEIYEPLAYSQDEEKLVGQLESLQKELH